MLAALPLWRARGPRFLLLLVMVWILLRAASWWPDPAGVMPGLTPLARPDLPLAVAVAIPRPSESGSAALPQQPKPDQAPPRARQALLVASEPVSIAVPNPPEQPSSVWVTDDRHRMRYAMLTALMPRSSLAAAAVGPMRQPDYFPGRLAAPSLAPIWTTPVDRRWSLSAYSYWRAGSGAIAPVSTNRPATLGGSQTAVRFDYRLASSPRLRAFARVTATPDRPRDADLAVGVALRPLRAVPVDLYVEQRTPLAGSARSRTLAYAAGGVDDRKLPFGFHLSAYAQGGVAGGGVAGGGVGGTGSVEAFVDGALSVQRPVFERRTMRLSVGAMVAGAAQSGAARIDAGPRATLRLPRLGQGASVALDWRERLAGDARPGSGLALTLSAGF